MRNILLSLSVFIFSFSICNAQLYELFEEKHYTDKQEETLLYRWLEPLASSSDKADVQYPLIIFLHGAGERGDNNKAQLTHVLTRFVNINMRNKYPCFIMAPQCPKEKRWANGERASDGLTQADSPSAEGRLVMELLDEIMKKYPIDKNRIYIGGLSMGGYGTWDLITRFPDRFAAAFPVCGGGDPRLAARIKDIPIWAFHGADDPVVPAHFSREMVKAIREVGGNPIYTEFEGVKHDSWEPAFDENPFVYDWIFSQKKGK